MVSLEDEEGNKRTDEHVNGIMEVRSNDEVVASQRHDRAANVEKRSRPKCVELPKEMAQGSRLRFLLLYRLYQPIRIMPRRRQSRAAASVAQSPAAPSATSAAVQPPPPKLVPSLADALPEEAPRYAVDSTVLPPFPDGDNPMRMAAAPRAREARAGNRASAVLAAKLGSQPCPR
jgi:hypothetical protein